MITFEQAYSSAEQYYQDKGNMVITKALDAGKVWIFYGGKDERIEIGGAGIKIEKENGRISNFILPSLENFALLKDAVVIDVVQR